LKISIGISIALHGGPAALDLLKEEVMRRLIPLFLAVALAGPILAQATAPAPTPPAPSGTTEQAPKKKVMKKKKEMKKKGTEDKAGTNATPAPATP
jgi:hypothetical protein